MEIKILKSSENIPSPRNALSSPKSASNQELNSDVIECDFDTNPSPLYLLIQSKKWEDAISRAESSFVECKTWTLRKEEDGRLRWKLLPLHAAIIFKAPERLVQTLLASYPHAARLKDDQGMLPIHLALRNESPPTVVQLLLVSFLQSLQVKDRKGRIPLVLAQNCKTSMQQQYIDVIHNAEGLYTVANAAVKYNDILSLQHQITNGDLNRNPETIHLLSKIDALEKDLHKARGDSNDYVERIIKLEAKLSSKESSENVISTKIIKLESSLKEMTDAKNTIEAQWTEERNTWVLQNDALQKEIDSLKEKIAEKESEVSSPTQSSRESPSSPCPASPHVKLLSPRAIHIDRLKELEKENQKLKSEVEDMESMLRKKIHSEHTLASQMSELAARLAESTSNACSSSDTFERRIETLLKEKTELQSTLEKLTLKVKSSIKTIESMTKDHDRILDLSSKHEEIVAISQKHQEELASNAARNEQMMIDSAWERDEIVRILSRQAKQVEQSAEERWRILEAIKAQNVNIAQVKRDRKYLVESINKQKSNMHKLMDDIDEIRIIAGDYYDDDLSEEESENESPNDGADLASPVADNKEDTVDTPLRYNELGHDTIYEDLLPNTSNLSDENDNLNGSDQGIADIDEVDAKNYETNRFSGNSGEHEDENIPPLIV